MKYFVEGLKNYVGFDGRATRRQFWFYYLWLIVLILITTVVDALIGTSDTLGSYGLISGIFILATGLPTLAIEIRRLHDIGKNGLWVLINLIPVIGFIILLIILCKRSDPGLNEYGPPANYIVLEHPSEAAGDPAGTEYVRSEENYKL